MEAPKRHNMSTETNKAELPLDLIESNILPRLPAKSVGRCMCVCKQWQSFLSTPTFARMHLRHITIHDYKLLLLDGQPPDTTFSMLDCNVVDDHHGATTTTIRRSNPDHSIEFILASLDGLVCLGSMEPTFKLAFWNPLTGAYRKLSSSHSFQFSTIPVKNAIGFYRDSSNDYKLVYLNMEHHHRGAYIYSLRLDSWREIDFAIGYGVVREWPSAIFCGQCVYFDVSYEDDLQRWILCFDVETENFTKRRYPPQRYEYCGILVVLNGCIQLSVSSLFETESYTITTQDRWRMDDNDGWEKVADGGALYYKEDEIREYEEGGICTASIGNWVAVLEDFDSFKKMNTEKFVGRRNWYRYPQLWEYISRRMIYVETLVSPYI